LNAYDLLIDQLLDIRDGRLHLSQHPGLGFEMDIDYLRHQALAPFTG